VVLAAESTTGFTSMNVLCIHSTSCALGESHGENKHCEGVWGDDSGDDGVWQTDERGEKSSPFATVLRSLIGVIASSTCLNWASFRRLSPPRDGRRESCKKSLNVRHSDLARFKLAQACSAATAARSSVGTSVVVVDGLASNVTAKIFARCMIISPSVSAPAAAARLSADTTSGRLVSMRMATSIEILATVPGALRCCERICTSTHDYTDQCFPSSGRAWCTAGRALSGSVLLHGRSYIHLLVRKCPAGRICKAWFSGKPGSGRAVSFPDRGCGEIDLQKSAQLGSARHGLHCCLRTPWLPYVKCKVQVRTMSLKVIAENAGE